MKKLLIFLMFILTTMSAFSATYKAPSEKYDFSSWKYETPKGSDIKNLSNYKNKYFNLGEEGDIVFAINPKTDGVDRNKNLLRNSNTWYVDYDHTLSLSMRIEVSVGSYEMNVAEIIGIDDSNKDVAPLVKIVAKDNNLYASVKNLKGTNEYTQIKEEIGQKYFTLKLKIEDKKVIVYVDGKEVLEKDVSFWEHKNSFRFGAYPQTNYGQYKVYVNSFSAY